MTTYYLDLRSKTLLFVLMIVALSGFTTDAAKSGRTEGEDWSGQSVGQDPHAFATAVDMYRTATNTVFDEIAANLVATLDARLTAGADLAEADLRRFLVQLDPYRQNEQVQTCVPRWASLSAQWVRKGIQSSAATSLDGNNAFIAGRFDEAVTFYMADIGKDPIAPDPRNNLALAELHLGHDLCAQAQLEMLRVLHTNYLPAMINLTVVYERSGRTLEATALAEQAVALQAGIPQASFNVAWYALLEGDYKKALNLTRSLDNLKISPKYASLKHQVHQHINPIKTQQPQKGFWASGLAGILHIKGRFWGVLVFLIGVILIVYFSVKDTFYDGGIAGAKFFIFGGLWGFVFWGVPVGGWWAGIILYLVVGTFFAVVIGDA